MLISLNQVIDLRGIHSVRIYIHLAYLREGGADQLDIPAHSINKAG